MRLFLLPILLASHLAWTNDFPSNYLGVKISRNDPTLDTKKSYGIGKPSLRVGFFHFNERSWLVGVESGHVVFKSNSGKSESFFSTQQQSLYIYRLDYPFYLGLGTQLSYLLPTLTQSIPPEEDKKRPRQIAAGLTGSLFVLGPDHSLLRFEINRWRGLRDNKLHSFEIGIGLYIPIR